SCRLTIVRRAAGERYPPVALRTCLSSDCSRTDRCRRVRRSLLRPHHLRQHLRHAMSLQREDLEPCLLVLHDIAHLRRAAEYGQDESADGGDLVVLQGDAKRVGCVLQSHGAGEMKTAMLVMPLRRDFL